VRDQNRHLIIYFIGLAVFGLVMSMGTYNPAYPFILDKLPYIRAPGRFLLLWTFSLAVLAGIFLAGLLKIVSSTSQRWLFKRAAYVMTAFSLITIAIVVWWNATDSTILSELRAQGYLADADPELLPALLQRSTLTLAATLVFITILFWLGRYSTVRSYVWGWLAITLLIVEMFSFARPLITPFPLELLVDPQNPLARLVIDPGQVRMDSGRGGPNYLLPTLLHVDNGEENVSLLNLLKTRKKGRQLLSASYIVLTTPSNDPELELVQQEDSAFLYRHMNTSPRIYATDSVKLVRNNYEALDIVSRDSFNQFDQSVLTLSSDEAPFSVQELGLNTTATGLVNFSGEYIAYENNLITAQLVVDRPSMVIFSELYFPGWWATVNGEPRKIWLANYAFRGVMVEAGEHIIEMRYLPQSFLLGAAVSLVTFSVILFTSIWLVIKSLRQSHP
jgi:hypothetical protein